MIEKNGKEHKTEIPPLTHATSSKVIKKLKLFAKKAKKGRQRFLYQRPEIRQFWGEEQEELETEWAELFFDLIFVAMAFKLGHQLEEDITDGEYGRAVLTLVAEFAPMFCVWFLRVFFLGRFVCKSLFHKGLDVLEGTMVAFMAYFIATSSEILRVYNKDEDDSDLAVDHLGSRYISADEVESDGELNYLLGYIVSFILVLLIYSFRHYEVKIFAEGETEVENKRIKDSSKINLLHAAAAYPCAFGALFCLLLDKPYGALWLLSISFVCQGPLFTLLFTRGFFTSKIVNIPIHVQFVSERIGEFNMLLLGEGVLQIIILSIDLSDTVAHTTSFGIAFLILFALQVLAYTVLPFEADDHVLRKSKNRAPQYFLLKSFYFIATIGTGVGLKLILKKQGELNKEKNERFEGLLLISITVVTFCLSLLNVTHCGIDKFFKYELPPKGGKIVDWKQVAFLAVETVSPFLFLWIRARRDNSAQILLVMVLLVLLFLFSVYFVDFRLHRNNHGSSTETFSATDTDFSEDRSSEKLEDETEEFDFNKACQIAKKLKAANEEKFQEIEKRRRKQLDVMFSYLRKQTMTVSENVENTSLESCSVLVAKNLLEEIDELEEVTGMIKRNLRKILSQNESILEELPNID
eukprot:maker-scaffold_50-snap-gene-0.3-mRNA-1 protein AED:0.00 eAED:0.00 QI:66/1/1/1/1/1/2/113/635